MKKFFAAGILAVVATQGVAQDSGDLSERVIDRIHDNECAYKMTDLMVSFLTEGVSEAEIRRASGDLVNAGTVSYDFANDMLILDPAVCAEQEEPSNPLLARPEIEIFMSVVSANGCAVSEADVGELFEFSDLDPDDAFVAGSRLLMAGLASFDAESQMLVIDPTVCVPVVTEAAVEPAPEPVIEETAIEETPVAEPVAEPAPVAAPDAAEEVTAAAPAPAMPLFSPREMLIAWIELNECSVHMHEFVQMLPQQGLSMAEASALVAQLSNDGLVQYLPDQGALLLHNTPGCP